MANLYVGPDGVIHSGSGNGVSYVGTGRKVFYWIFAIAVGIAIGIGLYDLVGSSIFAEYEAESAIETVENWFWSLAPWVFVIGGCVGSIFYGIYSAPERDYDLGAFILTALSAVGGIIMLAVALAVICGMVVLVMYMLGIIFVVMIVAAIVAGLCGS